MGLGRQAVILLLATGIQANPVDRNQGSRIRILESRSVLFGIHADAVSLAEADAFMDH
ncbi:MAG: hypothetical protein OXD44_08305 [Gammaproteobacteria bacterium]|nr:hypothetical protein [Gammaproteobacteria bacterium]